MIFYFLLILECERCVSVDYFESVVLVNFTYSVYAFNSLRQMFFRDFVLRLSLALLRSVSPTDKTSILFLFWKSKRK